MAGINIEMISTSEIRISVVVRGDDLHEAARVVHTAFGLDGDDDAVVHARHRPLSRDVGSRGERDASDARQASVTIRCQCRMPTVECRASEMQPLLDRGSGDRSARCDRPRLAALAAAGRGGPPDR